VIASAVLLFVAAADQSSAATEALVRSLSEALGPQVEVMLRGFQHPPTDVEVHRAARAEGALAAARLTWDDPDRLAATLHVQVIEDDRARSQRVVFLSSDPVSERGRALGLVISAHLLGPLPRARPQEIKEAAVEALSPALAPDPGWSVEAFGGGGIAFGGSGAGTGGGLALRRPLGPRWGLRLGARVRTGWIEQAQAELLGAALSFGVFRVLDGDLMPGQASLVVRLDALLLHEALTRQSAGDASSVRRSRRIPGAAAMLEMALPMGEIAAFYLGAGVDAALGTTEVLVKGTRVATMPPLRGVGEAGIRAYF
jgi:hypothetical protein